MGSSSDCSGSVGVSLGGPSASITTERAWTSPSFTSRPNKGRTCQPISRPSTSTAMPGLVQRSPPMWPPWRRDPLTSRVVRVWSAGRNRCTWARLVASDWSEPVHHQKAPASTRASASRSITPQMRKRHTRERRGGGGGVGWAGANGSGGVGNSGWDMDWVGGVGCIGVIRKKSPAANVRAGV